MNVEAAGMAGGRTTAPTAEPRATPRPHPIVGNRGGVSFLTPFVTERDPAATRK